MLRFASRLIAEAAQADPAAIVVYDVPLPVELFVNKLHPFDLILVVHADPGTPTERMVTLRGLDRAEARHPLNSEATDADHPAIADVVIDSNGTLDETLAQADALDERTRKSAHAG